MRLPRTKLRRRELPARERILRPAGAGAARRGRARHVESRDCPRGSRAQTNVCPYYLAQEMVRWSDVVIGDYNYFFDTSAILHGLSLQNQWRIGLLVDEAHNLLNRGRDMYSAVLKPTALAAAKLEALPPARMRLLQVERAWGALHELARTTITSSMPAIPLAFTATFAGSDRGDCRPGRGVDREHRFPTDVLVRSIAFLPDGGCLRGTFVVRCHPRRVGCDAMHTKHQSRTLSRAANRRLCLGCLVLGHLEPGALLPAAIGHAGRRSVDRCGFPIWLKINSTFESSGIFQRDFGIGNARSGRSQS